MLNGKNNLKINEKRRMNMTEFKNINCCPTCGNESIGSDSCFCEQCGTDLSDYQTIMECCGAKLLMVGRDPFKFCPFCGQAVKELAERL